MTTANPVLAQSVRGTSVENRHRGAVALARADGEIVFSRGDIDRPVFPRSAVKVIQALPIVLSGAAGRFGFSDAELALTCASHHGEAVHVETVRRLLARLGLDETALECGAHPPTNQEAREALREASTAPSPLHNNCSGKHAGMLAVALALGVEPRGYVEPSHPVQQAVRAAAETVLGETLSAHHCGTDGCSIPTYAVPLRSLATGFARLAGGEGIPAEHAKAARRLFDSATGHPLLVAGTGHPDTRLMAAFGGRLMQKVGAEAVQCGALRDKSLGYAIKCDDGAVPASQVMLACLLEQFAEPDEAQSALIEALRVQPIRSVRGATVGRLEPGEDWASA